MSNRCTNTIHITYYGKNDEENYEIYNRIYEELDDTFGVFLYFNSDDEIPDKIVFESEYVAPIEFLQEVCEIYNVDIIGVAYEFEGGYVESFELQNGMKSEEPSGHFIKLQAEDKENTGTFPLNDGEDVLKEDVDLEGINLDENI